MRQAEYRAEGLLLASETEAAILDRIFISPPAYTSVSHTLTKMLNSGKFGNIKDDQLIDTLELIRKVKESNPNFKYDLHPDHIMYRVNFMRVQLVLIDLLK